jgi:hypothetical protein
VAVEIAAGSVVTLGGSWVRDPLRRPDRLCRPGDTGVVQALVDDCLSDLGHDALVGQPLTPSTPQLRVSRRLAMLLDDLVRIPGTKQGVGLDALLGLVPGFGDLVGSGISGAIMFDAVRARVPVRVLAQMAWNLLLDAALGLVPLVGDVVDLVHHANVRNYRLLEKAVAQIRIRDGPRWATSWPRWRSPCCRCWSPLRWECWSSCSCCGG